MKFDPIHFEWFNLHPDPFFEEIMNLNTEMPIWPVAPVIPKMVIGAPGEGQVTCSELDCSTWVHFFKEILNLDREI
jgi:hypothetical protein